jgi:hypothetical protein
MNESGNREIMRLSNRVPEKDIKLEILDACHQT